MTLSSLLTKLKGEGLGSRRRREAGLDEGGTPRARKQTATKRLGRGLSQWRPRPRPRWRRPASFKAHHKLTTGRGGKRCGWWETHRNWRGRRLEPDERRRFSLAVASSHAGRQGANDRGCDGVSTEDPNLLSHITRLLKIFIFYLKLHKKLSKDY